MAIIYNYKILNFRIYSRIRICYGKFLDWTLFIMG